MAEGEARATMPTTLTFLPIQRGEWRDMLDRAGEGGGTRR